jgi:hypothetical protein
VLTNNISYIQTLFVKRASGALQYLATCARQDIQVAINKLSQHFNSYAKEYWEAEKCVVRYFKGTRYYLGRSSWKGKLEIYIYSGASYGSKNP